MTPPNTGTPASKFRGHTRKRSALDAVGPEADEVERTLDKVLDLLKSSGLTDKMEEFADLKDSVSNNRKSFAIIKEYREAHIGWDIKVKAYSISLPH